MCGIDVKRTGQRIKEICKYKNISVKDIQENLFIGSFQAIYAWFSGKSLPSLDNLYRLSRLLDVSMDSLIVGQEEKKYNGTPVSNLQDSWKVRALIYYMKLAQTAA